MAGHVVQCAFLFVLSLLDSCVSGVWYAFDFLNYFDSKPSVLLNLGNFLRALWQGAPQFRKIVDLLKFSDKFWKQLTSSIMLSTGIEDKLGVSSKNELQHQACRYQYQSILLDILGYEIFLQKKMMHARQSNQVSRLPSGGTESKEETKIRKDEILVSLKEAISTWCKSSSLGNLIKEYVTCEYDTSNHLHAKVSRQCFLFQFHICLPSICTNSSAKYLSHVKLHEFITRDNYLPHSVIPSVYTALMCFPLCRQCSTLHVETDSFLDFAGCCLLICCACNGETRKRRIGKFISVTYRKDCYNVREGSESFIQLLFQLIYWTSFFFFFGS